MIWRRPEPLWFFPDDGLGAPMVVRAVPLGYGFVARRMSGFGFWRMSAKVWWRP